MSQKHSHAPHASSWLDSWHVSPSLNKDYDVIDGLRGIAILMVVACHILYYNPNGGAVEKFIGGMIEAGAHGVTLFFALSGFLISLPFWKRKLAGNPTIMPPGYFGRRFWKIYPPLVFSIFLLTPVYVLLTGDNSYFAVALKWLVGIPILFPVESKLNPVMWSLVVELQFYATLPLLFLLWKKASYHKTLVAVFLMLVVIPHAAAIWHASRGLHNSLHPFISIHYPTGLNSFALGVLIGGLECGKYLPRNSVRFANAGMLLLVATLVMSSVHKHFTTVAFIPPPALIELLPKIASGLIVLYIANPQYALTRIFSATWLRWFGIISYEWYLFHQPVFRWTRQAFGGSSGGDLSRYAMIVLLSALGSLVLSALIYRFFSLPILRWGRSKVGKKSDRTLASESRQ